MGFFDMFWVNLRFKIWKCWYSAEDNVSKLYVLVVIAAFTYTENFLAAFVQYLYKNTYLSSAMSTTYVNVKEGVAGLFGILGSILLFSCLTYYGMIFVSSLLLSTGMALIIYDHQTSGRLTTYALLVIGLQVTGAGRNSLYYAAVELADKEEESLNARLTKNGTKIIYILLRVFIDLLYGDSTPVKNYHNNVEIWIAAISMWLITALSSPYYRYFMKPSEDRRTPFKRLRQEFRVFVVAFRNRRLLCPDSPPSDLIYEINREHPVEKTDTIRWLDKAALIQSTQPEEDVKQWRLCTLTEVEETKRILRTLQMCVAFLGIGLVLAMGNTSFLLQETRMRGKFGKVTFPIQILMLVSDTSGILTKKLYILVVWKRLSGSTLRYRSPLKCAIGLVLATCCCTVASWTAAEKSQPHDPVFWLIPQFVLFGAMREIAIDGMMEFFDDQLPPSVKKYNYAFTYALIGAGALIYAAIVNIYGSDLDQNEDLGKLYRTLTIACFATLFVYVLVASRYRYQSNDDDQAQVEEEVTVGTQTSVPTDARVNHSTQNVNVSDHQCSDLGALSSSYRVDTVARHSEVDPARIEEQRVLA